MFGCVCELLTRPWHSHFGFLSFIFGFCSYLLPGACWPPCRWCLAVCVSSRILSLTEAALTPSRHLASRLSQPPLTQAHLSKPASNPFPTWSWQASVNLPTNVIFVPELVLDCRRRVAFQKCPTEGSKWPGSQTKPLERARRIKWRVFQMWVACQGRPGARM